MKNKNISKSEDKVTVPKDDINNGSTTDKKYKYTFELQGIGGVFILGSIDDDTWDYIDKEFEGDVDSYCTALDNKEVPEDFCLGMDSSDLCDNDDLGHYHGWSPAEDFTLTIKQIINDKEKEVCVFNNDDNLELVYQYFESPSIDECQHYMTWFLCESGYMNCTLELDEPIDTSKLKLGVKRVLFDDNTVFQDFIVSIQYKGKIVDFEFDNSECEYCPEMDFFGVSKKVELEQD